MAREKPLDVGPVRVMPFEVAHPSGALPYALRFETGGKMLSLHRRQRVGGKPGAGWAGRRPLHHGVLPVRCRAALSHELADDRAHLDRIGAKRVMLTHMAEPMLARRHEVTTRASSSPKTAWSSRSEARRDDMRAQAVASAAGARNPRLPHMPRCAAAGNRWRTSRARCSGPALPPGSHLQPGARRARARLGCAVHRSLGRAPARVAGLSRRSSTICAAWPSCPWASAFRATMRPAATCRRAASARAAWHARLFAAMPQLELILAGGQIRPALASGREGRPQHD